MRWPGRRRAARGLSWLRSRGRPRALILGYHRVGGTGPDPHRLSVSQDAFEAHLTTIAGSGHHVPLSELVEALRSDSMDRKLVAVTFDDAYADTLRRVEPLLRARGVPATVFVPTRLLGTEPWWDRLARVLSADGHLPAALTLTLGQGQQFRRRLTEEERRPSSTHGDRDALIAELHRALYVLSDDDREAALDGLEDWAGAPESTCRERVVSSGELQELDRSDVFEIGSHSATHPVLPGLGPDGQRSEVEGSRKALEALLGHTVDLFSYPNGARDQATDAVVRASGYRAACGSQPGVATSATDPFALPRFWPVDSPNAVSHVMGRWL